MSVVVRHYEVQGQRKPLTGFVRANLLSSEKLRHTINFLLDLTLRKSTSELRSNQFSFSDWHRTVATRKDPNGCCPMEFMGEPESPRPRLEGVTRENDTESFR